MGPVYLLEGALTEEQLLGVRQLGPDYAFSFEPQTVDSRDLPLGSDVDASTSGAAGGGSGRQQDWHKAALSGALTLKIMLAYNPCVWEGELFLDNTPDQNPVRW
ncbi:unnamed protein product, partial [Discosporangium mesarthrocarpum]